jgi:hypothetical protein
MQSKTNAANVKFLQNKEIDELVNKKIIFGHASVGRNIISGLKDIIADDDRLKKLHIRELKTDDQLNESGFFDFIVKKNGFPKQKCDHFRKVLKDQNLGSKVDIAFFKLCYVDIEEDSNVQKIFDHYVETIRYVKKQFPKTKILHVTVPLYSHSWGLKGFIKRIIKPDGHNMKRNEFNEKLIQKYKGLDPIFDLAQVESTYPDGTRSTFEYKGKEYYSVANEYTYDGGHLNEIGRYRAAKKLIEVLCEVVSK